MLYYLPIEPLEERYTEQWYRWFPEEFKRQGIRYQTIDGETLVDEVQVGTFLDVNSTLYYKAEQLRRVAKLFHHGLIESGDKFFVADVEFWGIESIRYLATLNKVDVGILGFCHAGSYTVEDFMEPCAPFAHHYETAWGSVFDMIFVGSEYHKRMLVEKRKLPADKLMVTGNPYDASEVPKLNLPVNHTRVILTNRPDPEKRPEVTLKVFAQLKKQHPSWDFLVTTGRKQWGSGAVRNTALALRDQGVITIHEGISKGEYLELLASSRVMTGNTIEENFGYCVLEALLVDTIPVVPNDFSHPELLQNDERCLFDTTGRQMTLIERAIEDPFSVLGYSKRYEDSLAAIVLSIKEGRP